MNTKHTFYRHTMPPVLTAALLLAGCTPGTPEAAPAPAPEEAALSDQERFEQIIDDLFQDTLTSSGLMMHSTLSRPEDYGMTEFPETLGDYSLQEILDNYAELRDDYTELRSINPKNLSPELQVDYDVLMGYLETEKKGEPYALYDHPFSSISGMQVELPIILAEYSFRDREDVDHYLSLLADLDECYAQLLEYVQKQTEAGIYLSDLTIDGILDSCKVYLDAPEEGMMAETFETRLGSLPELTEEERASYLAENEEILKNDFTRAYALLTEGLKDLKGHLEQPVGTSALPDGKKYYEYLLHSSTFTSYKNPESLRDAIAARMQKELTRAYELMSDHPELTRDIYTFQPPITDPSEALLDLQEKLLTDFPQMPACAYEVRMLQEALEEFSSPAFYLTPPIDTQDENYIYINRSSVSTQEDIYTVMAHEGYPGHLYQCNYFNRTNDSRLRALMSFSCYVEGWATYVQYLAYGWEDGITPELAELLAINESVYLALYALVDYQVNYEGMTVDQLTQFMKEALGISSPEGARQLYQLVCEDPANYMKYYVGYLEITEMRETAEMLLGDRFSPKAFHTFLLDFGPAPFPVIRDHFSDWLAEQPVPGQ